MRREWDLARLFEGSSRPDASTGLDRARAGRDACARRGVLGRRGRPDGRDGHGVATRLGSFPFFVAAWVSMMGMLVGLAVYALYRPHGTAIAGALTIAAGLYELTPLKRRFRRRCRESVRTGFQFGLSCVGWSIGLMLTGSCTTPTPPTTTESSS